MSNAGNEVDKAYRAGKRETLQELKAKVEELPSMSWGGDTGTIRRDKVIQLIDEAINE